MEKKSIPAVKSKKLFIGGSILLSVITLAESLAFLEAKYKISGALNKLDDSNKIKDFLKSDWMYLIILASLIATMILIFAAVLRHKQNILIAQLNKLTQEKTELDTKLNKLTQEKTELETNLNKLTQEKTELETRLNTLTGEKNALQTNLDTLTQEKDALQTTSNADIKTLGEKIQEKQASIDELTQQLEDKKQEMSNVIDESCKKIEELNNKITSLENQLQENKDLYENLIINSELLLEKVSVLQQEQLRQSLNELITLNTSLKSEINNYKKEEEIFEKTSGEKSKRNQALEEKRKPSNSSGSNKLPDVENNEQKTQEQENRSVILKIGDTVKNAFKTNKKNDQLSQTASSTSSSPTNLSRSNSKVSNSESINEEIDFIKTAEKYVQAVKTTESQYETISQMQDPLGKINEFKKINTIVKNGINLTDTSIMQLKRKNQDLRKTNEQNLKTKQNEFLNKKTDDLYYLKDGGLFNISVLGSEKYKLNNKEYCRERQGDFDTALYSKTINHNIDNNSLQMNSLNILETIDITINNKNYKLIFNNQKMFLLNDENDQHFEVSSLS